MLQATEFREQGNKENWFLLLVASNKDLTNLSYAQWIFFFPLFFFFFVYYWVEQVYPSEKILR